MSRIRREAIALAALLAVASTLASAQQSSLPLRVLPQNPAAGEDFVIQVTGTTPSSPVFHLRTTSSVSGSTILLSSELDTNDFSVPGAYRAGAVVNVPVPGTYQLDMEARSTGPGGATYPRRTIGSVTVGPAITPAAPQFRGLTGLWWTPAEPGMGVSVTQAESGQLFVVWFTYRPSTANESASREGLWLVLSSGKWISPTDYRGILYEARGTPANRPFAASAGSLFPYGFATLRVPSADRIELQAVADVGISPIVETTKTLQRFLF